jgi:hypothetical protein
MLFGFDLNHLFFFPFENAEARKRFGIGVLVSLASFFIPILPYFVLNGYLMQIIRQVVNGEKPHLPVWEDWETLFKDGAKLFGVRFIYTLPLVLVMLPIFAIFFALPFLAETSRNAEAVIGLAFLPLSLMMTCLMPFFLALMIILPAAEIHVAVTGEFSAGFRIKEWWPIFRKNLGGFIVAFFIYYGINILMTFVFQFLILTVVFICLLPFVSPAYAFYLLTMMYTAFAQAYREGRAKLTAPISTPSLEANHDA